MLLLRISNGPHRVALLMSSLSRYGRLGRQPLDPLHGLHVVRGCAVLAVDTINGSYQKQTSLWTASLISTVEVSGLLELAATGDDDL